MKILLKISLSLLFLAGISSDLFARIEPANPDNVVGIPLDGGLLAVLAGAGIAYFAARKRKKNN